jgi:hypothetical protein
MIKQKNMLSECVAFYSKENPEKIKSFFRELKSQSALLEGYYAIDNLQNGAPSGGDLNSYIDMNVAAAKKAKTLFAPLMESKKDLSPLDKAIDYVISNEISPINADEYLENLGVIKVSLQERDELRKKQKKIPSLLEDLQKVLPEPLFKKLAENENKKEFFEEVKQDASFSLRAMITKDSPIEKKAVIYEAIDRINNTSYDTKTYPEALANILTVKEMAQKLNEEEQ